MATMNSPANPLNFPALSVDAVLFTVRNEALQVLLVQRQQGPFEGEWALPGGLVDPQVDESIDAAVQRQLRRKAGVAAPYLEQLKTYGDRFRDPRGWTATVVYFALVNADHPGLQLGEDAKWFVIQGFGVDVSVGFDHAKFVSDAVQRLRSKLEYSHIAVHLLPPEFTLPALQAIYELILQAPLDKSSFRRRVAEAGLVEATGNYQESAGRPAVLYRFRDPDLRLFFPRSPTRHVR